MTKLDLFEDIIVPASLDDITDTTLQRIYGIWSERKGSAVLPPPESIDYLDFPTEARDWYVLDVIDGGADYYCRFVGTEFAAMLGQDFSGQKYSEFGPRLPGESFQRRQSYMMGKVVECRAPALIPPKQTVAVDREHIVFSTMMLPFSHDGQNVTRILNAASFYLDPDHEV